ncbi:hypothetical protein Mapa_010095 [Marchantia paleacea]|nr:hypothetical protein Mapa_010095 [Marchantia paleacea]
MLRSSLVPSRLPQCCTRTVDNSTCCRHQKSAGPTSTAPLCSVLFILPFPASFRPSQLSPRALVGSFFLLVTAPPKLNNIKLKLPLVCPTINF